MSEGFSVEDALDEYVRAVEVPREPDGKWHPSSLYGCARKAVYEVRGTPESDPRDERSRRVLRVGHILHEFVQEAVERQAGKTVQRVEREVPVEIPVLNIVGTADQVVQVDLERWELHEYKSINSRAFSYNDLPKPDHVGQVTPYMRGLRENGSPSRGIPPLGDRLTKARITYVSKDDLKISEHAVLYTEAKSDDLTLRVAALDPYRNGTGLPVRLSLDAKGKKSWQCGFCNFATKCWEIDSDQEEMPGLLAAA